MADEPTISSGFIADVAVRIHEVERKEAERRAALDAVAEEVRLLVESVGVLSQRATDQDAWGTTHYDVCERLVQRETAEIKRDVAGFLKALDSVEPNAGMNDKFCQHTRVEADRASDKIARIEMKLADAVSDLTALKTFVNRSAWVGICVGAWVWYILVHR